MVTPKRIHSIMVNFDNHNAAIQIFNQMEDPQNPGTSIDDGASYTLNISNPKFDLMMSELAAKNVLDLPELVNYLGGL